MPPSSILSDGERRSDSYTQPIFCQVSLILVNRLGRGPPGRGGSGKESGDAGWAWPREQLIHRQPAERACPKCSKSKT